ncbi:MAG: SDR family oxidoreductase [bacterium]|nr:SDR family oxidoreductase [bacterium]
MKVLVTGGAGYIGCRLVPALLDAGHEVRVIDKLLFGDEGLSEVIDRIEMIPMDVREVEVEHLRGVDGIVHLAGLSNDPTAEYNPEANKSMNLDATVRLGRLAKEAGVGRFVFASSCSIYYSMTPGDELLDEEHEVHPEAPYSWSKRQAEIGLMEMADESFAVTALRKGTIYGQSPRMRYDLVINTFVRDAFAKRRLTLHAGGRMWRPMLGINQAVKAYIGVLNAPVEQVAGQIFNALSGNYQVIKLAHEVRRALEHQKGIRLDLDVQQVGTSRTYRVDGNKFHKVVDINGDDEIVSSAAEMWDELEQGVDVDRPIYYNIRWLELLSEMELRLKAMGGGPF